MQQAGARENGEMSWARAIVLATGFFFLSAIYLGQIPGFFQLTATQATLGKFSQTLLTTGLLALGLGLIGLTVSFLYDPKPLNPVFAVLFGLIGLGILGAGLALLGLVWVSGHQFLPDQTFVTLANGQRQAVNWPTGDPYLFNSIWFQVESIDMGGVGFVLTIIGGGIFGFAALYPLRERLNGPLRALLVQFSVAGGSALLLAYLTLYTFRPDLTTHSWASGAVYNVLLAVALMLILFATQVWLLPVMIAKENRQRFMPALYLHSVMLIGNVALPLLAFFAVLYPLVNILWVNHLNLDYWAQCSVKTNIPGSCTFTAYTGYLISAIVSGMFFTFLLAAGYLWSKKPAFVRLGSVFAFIFASVSVAALHTAPSEIPIAMSLAIGVAILGLVWTVSTQREFVPASSLATNLGCTGQWLVMGSALLIYIGAFAFFSFPNFLETEGNLIIKPGLTNIHDAYWVMLIAGSLAALQFAFLVRRQPLGTVRKLTLWLVLIGAAMEIAASIHFDLTNTTNLVNPVYYAGVAVEALGILGGAWGALMTRNRGGTGWLLLSAITVVVGITGAIYFQVTGPLYELVVAFSIISALGAILYVVFGADPPDTFLTRFTGGTPILPTSPTPSNPE